MDTLKNAGNYVADTFNSATSGASHEANKETAKNSNVGVGERIQSAGNAVKDKVDQKGYDASAEANKQSLKH